MEGKVAVVGANAELARRFARHLGANDVPEGTWTIDNAYYVADTRVVVAEVLEAGTVVRGAKAIVLVYEEGHKGTFQEIKRSYETWKDETDADVKLCVCHVGSESNREQQEELHWCVDAGFELVFAAIGEEERDERLYQEDEGCSGVERVRIALASETWPGMKPKAGVGSEEQDRTRYLKEEDEQQEHSRSEHEVDNEDDSWLDMETMIRRIRSAKASNTTKSDDERRKEAEEVVYSLMSMMGLDADEV